MAAVPGEANTVQLRRQESPQQLVGAQSLRWWHRGCGFSQLTSNSRYSSFCFSSSYSLPFTFFSGSEERCSSSSADIALNLVSWLFTCSSWGQVTPHQHPVPLTSWLQAAGAGAGVIFPFQVRPGSQLLPLAFQTRQTKAQALWGNFLLPHGGLAAVLEQNLISSKTRLFFF